MKINLINNLPDNINVKVLQDGDICSLIIDDTNEEKKANETRTLGDCGLGEFVKLGDREYVVLGHDADTTALITNHSAIVMSYGSNSNYINSLVRDFCNGEFYEELADVVGGENIVPHKVNLMCDDGTNKGIYREDNVSILTADNYRRYREYIIAEDKSSWLTAEDKTFWLATGVSTICENATDNVCIVGTSGIIGNIPFWNSSGVRPFCILNSSVIIS